MTCYCEGDFENRLESYLTERNNRFFILKNVPSSVCDQCGEVLYDNKMATELEIVLEEMEKPDFKVSIVENTELAIADFNDFKELIESKKNESGEKFVELKEMAEMEEEKVLVTA